MTWLTNPFFWALLSMLGLQGGAVIVSGTKFGRNLVFTTMTLTLVTVGRILLVLPVCTQPRFEWGWWNWIIGALILMLAGIIALPTMRIQWWKAPAPGMTFRTTGVYGWSRNPMYLAEVLWPIGWSIAWGSSYGLALTPLWWIGFLLHILIEENHLQRTVGEPYAEYKRKVKGRMLPGLPI